MKYIITGGCGFIGSHLAKSFIVSGHEVVVIDDLSTGSLKNIEELMSNPYFSFFQSDTLQFEGWDTILDAGDIIIHLAATVGVNKVAIDPLQTLENNYRSTILVLQLAQRHNCKVFFSSTSEVYGEIETSSSGESEKLTVPGSLCGRSAYILGKIISEQYCAEYYRKFGVPVIISRFFNVIGANQSNRFGMVVPTFIQQALNSEPITLFGDGLQTRSFCNIADLVTAIRVLINTDKAWGETFNIGSTERITIKELAEYINDSLGSRSQIVHIPFPYHRSRGRDIMHRSACIDKIRALTGWKPAIGWRSSVDNIIAEQLVSSNKLARS